MTGEEMERAIEFIPQCQADSEDRLGRIEAAQGRTQEQIAQTQAQLNHLTKVVASIADQTQRNSEDINVLARIVDRMVEGRRGGGSWRRSRTPSSAPRDFCSRRAALA